MNKQAERRRLENARILIRAANPNDNLAAYDPTATWFQPRPIIKKDKVAIARTLDEETE